ncbi:MAG: UDP-2,3-diacylglucosamine diphosphatase [gamma proteobacterium symbiont of Ctena orbiculata]|uniref:UDP-2,3-diacylglucosamine hydrolase n=1 Tax=Candidatus Thiodiazotropha taylori TaxID=2792791 RepID=A0A944QV97_9GAMM|nr:UDP-2,3-diacylglucosamine diphosphatase [Candidatus Thiodiazotropha taylori]PUB88554.1 MAG: UDP-2,3-diacylglucosamine diphosphatase [gamma proteobacterium symbiont of Ctena orbiculata]MBT2989765.1 UDP-2,3-diacylglucosamine diphosphatase [Candidatus Thiodiazotropha taylori]MBT2995896.1 UDP-2,3-diacylglucosamine diphosphatase [Candidatus Thiodiazotropha taylori]MBT2999211.1 UDP-2,3-diacylglucosamine diphosphatase [Candidatus Thiodiazotropha taylori]
MTQSLFISDLHLSAEETDRVRLFLRFLTDRAPLADHLYILGDLFDAWVGDDNMQPPIPEIKLAMHHLSDAGTRLWLMHGNRDFLIGDDFCRETGATLLQDPTLVDLYGTPTLLMHGDLLCSDDVAYQQFRREIREPENVKVFLSHSLAQRLALAQSYREKSGEAKSLKPESIMDVNQETVKSYLIEYGAERLIHGHTHRPADHRIELRTKPVQRHVLAEWRQHQAESLCVTPEGVSRERFR